MFRSYKEQYCDLRIQKTTNICGIGDFNGNIASQGGCLSADVLEKYGLLGITFHVAYYDLLSCPWYFVASADGQPLCFEHSFKNIFYKSNLGSDGAAALFIGKSYFSKRICKFF